MNFIWYFEMFVPPFPCGCSTQGEIGLGASCHDSSNELETFHTWCCSIFPKSNGSIYDHLHLLLEGGHRISGTQDKLNDPHWDIDCALTDYSTLVYKNCCFFQPATSTFVVSGGRCCDLRSRGPVVWQFGYFGNWLCWCCQLWCWGKLFNISK